MGRFAMNDADNYGGNGGSNFFSLKNDKDMARVRFMYNDATDVEGYAVHQVKVGDKDKYVNCLRSYNESKDKCPLCSAGNMQRAKLYIPLYDLDADEVKLWERGKNFFPKISSICARYATGNTPLVAHTFDIERHGKPHDTGTQYEIYETGCDNTRLEDLPDLPTVVGPIVLDKSYEELQYYAENGYFQNSDGAPARSRESEPEESFTRRTPSRRGEAF